MNLIDIVTRKKFGNQKVSQIAEDFGKIPWDDPGFSARMLENHLAQGHDWASRRNEHIERQCAFIAKNTPTGGAILDLGCGPGLYLQCLSQAGYRCHGVDFSPASIEYARAQAMQHGLSIEYEQADLRGWRARESYDSVLLLFGELNAFGRQEAAEIVAAAAAALKPGGKLFLEAHTFEAVRQIGLQPSTWQGQESGLFSERPHLLLLENHWDKDSAMAVTRYYLVDAEHCACEEYASEMCAYSDAEYRRLLEGAGCKVTGTVSGEDWPSGEEFEGKLITYLCEI